MTAGLGAFVVVVGADAVHVIPVPQVGMLGMVLVALVAAAFNTGRMRPCKTCKN